jgi:hypothetical protein
MVTKIKASKNKVLPKNAVETPSEVVVPGGGIPVVAAVVAAVVAIWPVVVTSGAHDAIVEPCPCGTGVHCMFAVVLVQFCMHMLSEHIKASN